MKNKDIKKARKEIKKLVEILRKITLGQGYVDIHIFDTGVGGGFEKGAISIEWLRDGYTGKVEAHEEDELIEGIMNLFSEVYEGLIIEVIANKK